MDENNQSRAGWTDRMVRKEVELGCPLQEVIRQQVEQGKSWAEVADHLEISRVTLQTWRKRLGIRKRSLLV